MRISIFGMGYVGVVTGACLAKEGHRVIGVDIAKGKVDMLNAGQSPVVEEGLSDLVAGVVRNGSLSATTSVEEAVNTTEISLISVGTPSCRNGSLDLKSVCAVAEQIGTVLADKPETHVVVVRSTVLPGTTRNQIIPRIEATSGKEAGRDFHVCFNPEFLREGSSIKDFYDAPFTVIGEGTPQAGEICAHLYETIDVPMQRCSIEVAEALKYVCNAFHALKVAFANEVGVLLKALDVDSHPVMKLVCEDRKLNISPVYLRPGFAFGGSCLPKDLRAILYAAKERDVNLPMLSQMLPSNDKLIETAVQMVLDTGERDIAMLGLSFKSGTDDLRESPLVILAERLIGKGRRLRIFDPEVLLARLTGANKAYIEKEIPHIGDLVTDDLDAALDGVKVAVIGNGKGCALEVLENWAREGTIIDLQRVPDHIAAAAREYEGISW